VITNPLVTDTSPTVQRSFEVTRNRRFRDRSPLIVEFDKEGDIWLKSVGSSPQSMVVMDQNAARALIDVLQELTT
jgi:hypothetical protein